MLYIKKDRNYQLILFKKRIQRISKASLWAVQEKKNESCNSRGGAAGISTASNIRRNDDDAEIIVITMEKHIAYSPAQYLMFYGDVEHFEDIVMHQPEDYLEKNIKVITNFRSL